MQHDPRLVLVNKSRSFSFSEHRLGSGSSCCSWAQAAAYTRSRSLPLVCFYLLVSNGGLGKRSWLQDLVSFVKEKPRSRFNNESLARQHQKRIPAVFRTVASTVLFFAKKVLDFIPLGLMLYLLANTSAVGGSIHKKQVAVACIS